MFQSNHYPRNPTIVDIMSSAPPSSYGGLCLSPLSSPYGGTPVRTPSSSPPGTPPKHKRKQMIQMSATIDDLSMEELEGKLTLTDPMEDS